jgi:UDP-N-acetylglucosamine 2-epimerase (non-hydrolysing)
MTALAQVGARQTLVHTGQHFDPSMSDIFFEQLGLPRPDVNLGVGSGSHAAQTARIMQRLEPVLVETQPGMVVVYGDVNSTVSAALVCAKLPLPLAHVEAGLRSGDCSMPEEINRLVTDRLADLLFTPSADADENLRSEGIPPERIHLVGNVMIDSLLRLLPRAQECWQGLQPRLPPGPYLLVTLHRPSNVDDPRQLSRLVDSLGSLADRVNVLFPVHPRTRQAMTRSGLSVPPAIHLMEPQGYLDFLALQAHAAAVITDSGGLQEETTCLGIPCLTLRENTERPVTVSMGTNTLVGADPSRLPAEVEKILAGNSKKGRVPPLWDGHAAERIANILNAIH